VNFTALTPLTFLARSSAVYPDKLAIIYGTNRFTYRQFYERCCRLADALRQRGIRARDTVAVMAPNIPPLLEAHYGVPMAGAVLNALNTHLDSRSIGFILAHGEAKLLIFDREFAPIVAAAMAELDTPIPLVEIDDGIGGASLGGTDYEDFLREGDPAASWERPPDEWEPIALNYTSGTTGNPKGVVYHHRGAFLNAISNAIIFGLDGASFYLWTLPMFHCNGWTFTWAVTAVAGAHVCLRRIDPASIFSAIAEHRVTHMCGAPIILNLLAHAPEQIKRSFDQTVEVATGGAAPPAVIIEAMERMGFRVTHLYGLTESYGPSTVCAWQDTWAELSMPERAARMARQGVANLILSGHRVVDPETMNDVPSDGSTLGELVLRGNTLMRGYFKNPAATEAAFEGGWFHTGDLAVQHSDGYIEIKDRSKDIIIVGGDNLSSLEVEDVLYRHPQILEAAVVAKPDPVWGEVPCAFVTLMPDAGPVSAEDILGWCRSNLAHFKMPRTIVFGPLPKTSTGKVQKFELRERAREIAAAHDQCSAEDLPIADTLEQDLQRISERVLAISPIRPCDNILEYGADSLKVLSLFLEIQERAKCDVGIGDLFATPTIAGIASVIREVRRGAEPHKVASPKTPVIRSADRADIEPLCRFLQRGFSRVPPDSWRCLFDYSWLVDKPDLGLVLTIGSEIVGFLGAVYAQRKIGKETGLVCNHTSWYVVPEYRGWGADLLATVIRNDSVSFTALTPGPSARPMLEALGYSELTRRKIAMPPLLHFETLRERAPVISFDREAVRGSLDREHQRVFDDHAPYECLQCFVHTDLDCTFLVVKRRVGGNAQIRKLFPTTTRIAYSEILYCSNPPLLARHIERVKQAIMRRQRTLLLVCDECLLPDRPRGLPFEAPAFYKSSQFGATELDKLYSELVLLPI
jgi:fatty-acyl-CoA synthase